MLRIPCITRISRSSFSRPSFSRPSIAGPSPADRAAQAPQRVTRRAALTGLLLAPMTAGALAGCSDDGTSASDSSAASDGTAASDSTAASDGSGSGAEITVTDPWVKAADSGMTAAFATLTNTSSSDVTLVAVTTPASDMVQLHETASDGSGGMSMQEKEGGFEIPAGQTLVLEPGGDHIMLMDLAEPLLAGDTLDLALVLADGTEIPMTATIKDFTGADEDYGDQEDHGSDSGHDSDSDHASDGGEG